MSAIHRPLCRVAAVPIAVVLLLSAVAPTFAGGVPGADPAEYGAHGACMYRSTVIPGHGPDIRLRRMVIHPPNALYARHQGQTVGWRFIVKKVDVAGGTNYKSIFTGTIHTSPATLNQPGHFNIKSAEISWQDPVGPSMFGHFYKSVAKFYWYSPSGALRRVESILLSPYTMYVDGVKTGWWIYGGCYELWPNLPF